MTLNKIKQFFLKLWGKMRPYIALILTFLSGLVCLFVLGRKTRQKSTYDVLKANQEKREKNAEKIQKNVNEIEKDTENLINDFEKRRLKRRE